MNTLEHIATTAAEEALEVAHRITKALRFGFNEVQPGQEANNGDRIMDEFYQLCTMLLWLQEEGAIDPFWPIEPSAETQAEKRKRVIKFMALARESGALS